MTRSLARSLRRILLHPTAVFTGILLGGLYGLTSQGQVQWLITVGDIYVRLLQMCVIPLLFTAVVISLSKLLLDGAASRYIGRLAILMGLGLVIAGGLGTALGEWVQPGAELQQSARAILGEVVIRAEALPPLAQVHDGPIELADVIISIVPDNVFFALTSGNKLAVLFFAVLFGVALGSVSHDKSDQAILLFEVFYETFIKIIEWLMYILPIGLFCLAYGQVTSVGTEVLIALTKFVLLIYVGSLALIFVCSIVIWSRVGGSYWTSVAALRETSVIAFGTSNSFAAVPAALRALKDALRLDRSVVDLVMPLGITLNPPGSVFHFAMATIFVSNLYGMELDPMQHLFVLFASVLAGIASSGAPGVAALSMITIILVPLGLPVEVAIILLVAIDPIVDPILTVVNVQANAATTALLGAKHQPGGVKGTWLERRRGSAALDR